LDLIVFVETVMEDMELLRMQLKLAQRIVQGKVLSSVGVIGQILSIKLIFTSQVI